MSVNIEKIKTVANLARLQFSEAELPNFADEFNQIMVLVDQISQKNTSGVEPLSNPLEQTQRLREDRSTRSIDREKMQTNAPEVDSGLYLVPPVIE